MLQHVTTCYNGMLDSQNSEIVKMLQNLLTPPPLLERVLGVSSPSTPGSGGTQLSCLPVTKGIPTQRQKCHEIQLGDEATKSMMLSPNDLQLYPRSSQEND